MARGDRSIQEMEEAFALVSIEEEDHGGINYGGTTDDLSEIDTRWCLVGKFLTDSPIDFQVMQHKMASLWRPGKGLYVKQIESNRFLFQFYHEVDIKRVMEGSPWTFGRFHLILERLREGDNPRTKPINRLDIWVQLHDMNAGFMSLRVVTDVGNYIGKFIESDPNNFVGVWREFLRIRVSLPIDVPIKRRMKLKKSEDYWCWVNFKYEAIPTFCFICGMVGHGEKFCEKLFEGPGENIEKAYGSWLRADPRRKSHTMGSRWLRNPASVQATISGGNDGGNSEKGKPAIGAELQQTSTIHGTGLGRGSFENAEVTGGSNGDRVGINKGGNIGNSVQQANSKAGNGQFQKSQDSRMTNELDSEVNDGPYPEELFIVDPKKRKLGFDKKAGDIQELEGDINMETGEENTSNSKNELLAGSVMQTRQSL